jgi:hypothetical protein
MGQEITVRPARSLAKVLMALSSAGVVCQIVMVDGQLVLPSLPAPDRFDEVRLRTPSGMITLKRRGEEIAVVVFGNADAPLVALGKQIAAAFASGAP